MNGTVPPTGTLAARAIAGYPGNGVVVVVSGAVVGGLVVGAVVLSGWVDVVEGEVVVEVVVER